MALGWHVLNNGQSLLKEWMFDIPVQLEHDRLEGRGVRSGLDHALQAHVAVVCVHGANGIDNQVDMIAILQQVKASLLNADVRLAAIEHNLVTLLMSVRVNQGAHVVHHFGLAHHRERVLVEFHSPWVSYISNHLLNIAKVLPNLAGGDYRNAEYLTELRHPLGVVRHGVRLQDVPVELGLDVTLEEDTIAWCQAPNHFHF